MNIFCISLKKRRGFTMVELITVTSIVFVLISLLLPGLKSVRDSAKSASCLNNLRQIGLAFQQYANEYDDFLPLEYYYSGNPVNKVGWGWQVTLGNLLKSDPSNTAFPRQHSVFVDSTAQGSSYYYDWTVRGIWNMGYGINVIITEQLGYAGNPTQSYPPSRWPFRSSYLYPGSVMLVVDTVNLSYTTAPAIGSSNNVDFRHKGGANVLYLDGHCNYILSSQYPSSQNDVFWKGN